MASQQIEIYNTIIEIKDIWDNFLPQNHHLQSNFIKPIENSTTVKCKYVLVKIHSDLVGVMYLQNVNFNQDNLSFNVKKLSSIECLLKTFLWASCDLNLWVCGNLFRTSQQGFYFKESISEQIIFDCLAQFNSQHKSNGVLIKEVAKPLEISETSLFKYQKGDFTIGMHVDTSWQSMQDYEKMLSKKYRKRYQKISKSGQDLQFIELELNQIIDNQAKLFELHQQVVSQQSVKLGEIRANYFAEMKQNIGENFKLIGVYHENNLVAFSTHIFTENARVEMHYIGIDYAKNEICCLYFNLLFNGLKIAIETKQNFLELGRTAHIAKESLGATAHSQNNYIYLKHGVAKLGFWVLNRYFLSSNELTTGNRNPFVQKNVEIT